MCPRVPKRRLEDSIRELCRQLAADDGTLDAGTAIAELRKALAVHALRISNKTAASVFTWPDFPKNRRRAA